MCIRDSRATASWPQAGSGRTARSGPGTRSGCWSSRVSFSEDVRAELAGIAPARECDRLAELSALFHFAGRLHLLGRGEVSYTHLRAHETPEHLVCRLLLEKKKKLS